MSESDRSKRDQSEAVVFVVAIVAVVLCLFLYVTDGPAAELPLRVRVAGNAVAYTPSGILIQLPAGTEIDACAAVDGGVVDYDIAAGVVGIDHPCPVRPLFGDGFE